MKHLNCVVLSIAGSLRDLNAFGGNLFILIGCHDGIKLDDIGLAWSNCYGFYNWIIDSYDIIIRVCYKSSTRSDLLPRK